MLSALRRLPARIAGLLAVALFVVSCSSVPYSGRTRIILMGEGEEHKLGDEAYRQILGESRLSNNFQQAEMIRRVGQKIAAIADKDLETEGREPFSWEFNLIESPDVNAFCLPGGKVAFFTGILPICGGEDGVAVVMGHEVAHALARHGGERISQQMVVNVGVAALAAAMSSDPETQETVAGLLGAGAAVAVVLPFSRKHESESDYIGLMLMAQAGYDPSHAPQFWERMKAASGGEGPPGFLSTHPPNDERIEGLRNALPEALDYYKAATGRRGMIDVQGVSSGP